MFKRNAMLKKKKGDKEKAEPERTDAVSGHGNPEICQCLRHRAQRGTGGKQQ